MLRKLFFGIGALIVLVIAFNLITQIVQTLKSTERLNELITEVQILEIKNRELKEKLTEIQSDEFIEAEARDKLGLGKSGETVVIIAEEKVRQILGASSAAAVERLPNWLGWWKVFFK